MDYDKNAEGSQSLLKLSKSKTETGRKCFATQGALIFNDLAKNTRDKKSLLWVKN